MRKEAQKTIKYLVEYLNRVANITPICPEWGPHPLFSITVKYQETRYVFKIRQHPECIRERAERLRKNLSSFSTYGGLTGNAYEMHQAANWKPLLSRPKKPIKSVAQQFLDDGEKENWAAYQGLFNA